MEKDQRQKLLQLARTVLEKRLKGTAPEFQDYNEKAFNEKRGVFVTLHLDGELKGCIGHIEASESVYDNVIYLSQAAAFEDGRFSPLTEYELDRVEIEISILSVPEKLTADSNIEMVNMLRPGIDGVILLAGYQHSTFLPQVWEQLPDRESFMTHLCMKAGASGDYWKFNPIELSIYQVECFSENKK